VSDVVIEVGENGPYHVIGRIPVRRVSKVETEKREPIDWHVYEELPLSDEYWLCRCGGSDDKPWCVGAHSKNGFDGTEAAPTNSYADRAKALGGSDVTVVDDRSICTHAGFCSNRITNAWKAASLIDDDEALRDQLVEMVQRCPSGALTLLRNGSEAEPDLPVAVSIQKDGPLLVTGRVRVQRADGEPFEIRNRVALCRCGGSSIKPLCDGTHKEIGFTDG
jgi:CDGSH-type Zn-finger protein